MRRRRLVRLELCREVPQDQRRLVPGLVLRQLGQVIGRGAPAIQRCEEAVDRLLQYRRVIADLG